MKAIFCAVLGLMTASLFAQGAPREEIDPIIPLKIIPVSNAPTMVANIPAAADIREGETATRVYTLEDKDTYLDVQANSTLLQIGTPLAISISYPSFYDVMVSLTYSNAVGFFGTVSATATFHHFLYAGVATVCTYYLTYTDLALSRTPGVNITDSSISRQQVITLRSSSWVPPPVQSVTN